MSLLDYIPARSTNTYFKAGIAILLISVFAAIGTYHSFNSRAAGVVGDINGDGTVNITDLSLLLSSYGQNTTQCVSNASYKCDLSSPGDGVVNVFDLSILLSNYGQPVTPPPPPPPPPPSTPVAIHGKLSVSGNRIIDEHGQVVELRGMSFGWSNWWGQYWNAPVVDWLNDDWKVDIVRAAMGIEPNPGGYLVSPTTEKAKVKAVVDEAIHKGVYVIIDWHEENASQHVSQATAFFNEMATTYGQYPNVIYEIWNEPNGYTWPQIKAYANTIDATIRAKDPDNLIIVGTPTWSQDVDIAASSPLVGSNIAYTLHFYAATHKQFLRDKATTALSKGIALFVTEWGECTASGSGTRDLTEAQTWLNFMDTNHISNTKWYIGDSTETCATLVPNAPTQGGWTSSQLSASGNWIRGILRNYAGAGP